MFINKDSVIINGISIGKYVTSIKYGFHDVWSSSAGYNLANKFSGTFKGTFPKFTLVFAKGITMEDLTILTNAIFRKPTQTITYDDPSGERKTITTHKGDLVLDFYGINKKNGFQYELVGNESL